MNITPLKDNVLIARSIEETKTDSGLYIPDSAQEISQRAIVRAIGPKTTAVKVNDVILLGKYVGVQIGDQFMVSEEDILAVISE